MTVQETFAVIAAILLTQQTVPSIIRRPRVVGLTERFELDKRAVHRIQEFRNKYGTGPLALRTPLGPT